MSGSEDKTLKLWDALSGAHLKTLPGHLKFISCAAFSPDSTRIVSGSGDNTLQLWDALSRAYLNTLTGHSDVVESVIFSPDDTQLVSGSRDKTSAWKSGPVWSFVQISQDRDWDQSSQVERP